MATLSLRDAGMRAIEALKIDLKKPGMLSITVLPCVCERESVVN